MKIRPNSALGIIQKSREDLADMRREFRAQLREIKAQLDRIEGTRRLRVMPKDEQMSAAEIIAALVNE